ncbi:MAG: YebC/PmpR family DNA-binding transcriptional regulator [Myxococcota bacterium]
MSGHSKWSTIKHKKGKADAKRGKIFTKLIREITVAAREKGGDPDMNPRLRTAIDKAKGANMPNDTIERAIKRGSGEGEETHLEELVYEAYGPSGVAILIEVMTDNKNRTTPEIKKILSKHNGALGAEGSVAYMFSKKGVFFFNKSVVAEDALMETALELGANDVEEDEDGFEVTCDPHDFNGIKEGFDKKGLKYESAEIEMSPQSSIEVSGDKARTILNLLEALEDHDDVQNVYANCNIRDADK